MVAGNRPEWRCRIPDFVGVVGISGGHRQRRCVGRFREEHGAQIAGEGSRGGAQRYHAGEVAGSSFQTCEHRVDVASLVEREIAFVFVGRTRGWLTASKRATVTAKVPHARRRRNMLFCLLLVPDCLILEHAIFLR